MFVFIFFSFSHNKIINSHFSVKKIAQKALLDRLCKTALVNLCSHYYSKYVCFVQSQTGTHNTLYIQTYTYTVCIYTHTHIMYVCMYACTHIHTYTHIPTYFFLFLFQTSTFMCLIKTWQQFVRAKSFLISITLYSSKVRGQTYPSFVAITWGQTLCRCWPSLCLGFGWQTQWEAPWCRSEHRVQTPVTHCNTAVITRLMGSVGQTNIISQLYHLMLVGRSVTSTSLSSPSTADTMALINFLSAHRQALTSQGAGLKEVWRSRTRRHSIQKHDTKTRWRIHTCKCRWDSGECSSM